MPFISVELFKGRTSEQKEEFARAVAIAARDILKAKPSSIRISFTEKEREDIRYATEFLDEE